MPAMLVIVIERVDVGIRHIGVGGQISIDIEQRIWIATFLPAEVLVMLEGVDFCGLHIRIVLQVEDVIEAVRPDKRMPAVAVTGNGILLPIHLQNRAYVLKSYTLWS